MEYFIPKHQSSLLVGDVYKRQGNKYSAFEGGTRIPAILSWPKEVKKGKTSDLLVSQVDWLASLASLTGAGIPKGTAPDSYNFLGSWLGKEKKDRPWVIEQASNHTLSVRTKDWKYIEPNGGPKMIQWGPCLLYTSTLL